MKRTSKTEPTKPLKPTSTDSATKSPDKSLLRGRTPEEVMNGTNLDSDGEIEAYQATLKGK